MVVHGCGQHSRQTEALVAFALFTTAIVFAVATISNDNLQDLKTGQLVGATPWRQQVALIVGVAFGSAVIPSGAQPLNKPSASPAANRGRGRAPWPRRRPR
jgi:putative OPT family oligopeptide transporter